ncbi:endolytic transglycosylase MltG [Pseudonocardia sp. CA-107938]|uniref:endolytic transglycosylase MltG n=1 Tax=Pseudonocardia sp. CA-107938 TaxID=3240021 RepID=UPI003D918493
MSPDGSPRRRVDSRVDAHRGDDRLHSERPTERLATVPNRRERQAAQRARAQRAKRRRRILALVVVVLLAGIAGGGYVLYQSFFGVPDFEGDGTGSVVVQVADGDTTSAIGSELAERGVVADPRAFTRAAADSDRIRSVQPGFYQLRSHMSGDAAVTLLLTPQARVGQLEIRGGLQLDDTRSPDGTVNDGVLTQISKATCLTVDGTQRCTSAEDLRTAMATTDPAELGVPEWALEGVAKADPKRRLEGLLVPGRYDLDPGKPAVEVLRGLLATSASRLQASGLVSGARQIGSSPYQVLIISSLVEKESITKDMPKIARVIYNRLGIGQRLELDSMVNYPLDLQAIRTNAADRDKPGPYNSYTTAGLPPTPIAAPGRDAIAAALKPEPGNWFFFVRCEKDGTSCFAKTLQEHQANVSAAVRNGAF